jgi:hypothetical protein
VGRRRAVLGGPRLAGGRAGGRLVILIQVLGHVALIVTAWLFWVSARSAPIVDQVPAEGL